MKYLYLLVSAALISFLAGTALAAKVDVGKSKVVWIGAKVIGDKHTGEIKVKTADLKYENGQPVSGRVVVDMNSITNTDISSPKYNKKLVGHLKSDDFFSVSKFKTATLEITKIEKQKGKKREAYDLSGNMTIKGKTRPVKMTAIVTSETDKVQKLKIDFSFDRTEFDVRYASGKFFKNLGDKMIKDDIQLSIEVHIQKDKVVASN